MTNRSKRRLVAGTAVPVAVAATTAAVPFLLKRTLRPAMRSVPHTPGDLGMAGREVWLEGRRDKALHGWWIPTAGVAPAIVFLHGWGANASLLLPFARPLHHAGFHVFMVDARNHGLSESDDYASMPRFAEDLDVALDWVHGHARVTNVGVVGHSLGAGAAALVVANRDDVDALVSVSGVADVWQVMEQHTVLGRLPSPAAWALRRAVERMVGTTFADVAPEQVVARLATPLMVVHGDEDEIVPLGHAYRLVEAAKNAELLVVPGGRHGEVATFEPHLGPILDFLTRHLGRARSQQAG